MKAKYVLHVTDAAVTDGQLTLQLAGRGNVENTILNAKESSMTCTLVLKGVAAKDMKIMSTMTVAISDEEVSE